MSTTYLLRALNRAERKYSNIIGRESLKRTKDEWIYIALVNLLATYEEKIWDYDMEQFKQSWLKPQEKWEEKNEKH